MNFQQTVTTRPLTPGSALHALDYASCHIDHLTYRCPIYVWLSSAKYRNGPNKLFVYVEYRDVSRASHYSQWAFDTLEQAQDFIRNQAAYIELPNISGLQTRRSPIKSSFNS